MTKPLVLYWTTLPSVVWKAVRANHSLSISRLQEVCHRINAVITRLITQKAGASALLLGLGSLFGWQTSVRCLCEIAGSVGQLQLLFPQFRVDHLDLNASI